MEPLASVQRVISQAGSQILSPLRVVWDYYFPTTLPALLLSQPTLETPPLPIELLTGSAIPTCFRPATYFTTQLDQFEHRALILSQGHVFAILDELHQYATDWLNRKTLEPDVLVTVPPEVIVVGSASSFQVHQENPSTTIFQAEKIICLRSLSTSEPDEDTSDMNCLLLANGAQVLGGTFDLSKGSIYIGRGTVIEPGVFIAGPVILGATCSIRFGAYLRGDVILGSKVVVRSELKNVLLMDQVQLTHPGYCGDSICGFKSHFGNQVSAANLPLHQSQNQNIILWDPQHKVRYDTGRRKIGVIMGDYAQIGCNAVTDPGTVLGRHTAIYPLTRVNKNVYPSFCLIKNKPMEKGIVEVVPFIVKEEKDDGPVVRT